MITVYVINVGKLPYDDPVIFTDILNHTSGGINSKHGIRQLKGQLNSTWHLKCGCTHPGVMSLCTWQQRQRGAGDVFWQPTLPHKRQVAAAEYMFTKSTFTPASFSAGESIKLFTISVNQEHYSRNTGRYLVVVIYSKWEHFHMCITASVLVMVTPLTTLHRYINQCPTINSATLILYMKIIVYDNIWLISLKPLKSHNNQMTCICGC